MRWNSPVTMLPSLVSHTAAVDVALAIDTDEVVPGRAFRSRKAGNTLEKDLAVDHGIDGRPVVAERELVLVERFGPLRVFDEEGALLVGIGGRVALAVVVATERLWPGHDGRWRTAHPSAPGKGEDFGIHDRRDISVESGSAERAGRAR